MSDKRPVHSFGIATASEMLAKLERELERVANSTFDPQDVVDHSINCALTAWHMVDWVWQMHFRRDGNAQAQLAAIAGVSNPAPKDAPFVPGWVRDALLGQCSGLKVCEDIAIGAKHVYPEIREPEAIETRVSARTPQSFTLGVSTLGGGDVLAPEDGALPETQYLPKLEMGDGQIVSMIESLDSVVLFWRRLLKDFAIL